LLLALALLGMALFDWHGGYSPQALGLLLSALALLAAALTGPGAGVREGVVVGTGLAGLGVSFALIAGSEPALDLLAGARVEEFSGLVAVAALAAGVAILDGDRLGKWAAWLALGLFALAAVWVLQASPRPKIDVFVIHDGAASGLLAGENPYAMRFDQIYSPELAVQLYGSKSLDAEGRLDAGYTYLPLTILTAVPGRLLGDVRYGNVLAVVAAAAFMLGMGGGTGGRLAAMTFLFSPMNFFVLEMAWTEVWSAALFAGFVWSLAGGAGGWRRGAAPWIFGLLLVSKQHLPLLVLPVAWVCLPETRRIGFLWRMLVAGMVVTLPMILWNPAAFWQSAVVFLGSTPFRYDGLSIGSALHTVGVRLPGPVWWVFGLGAFGGVVFGLRRCGGDRLVRFAVGSGLAMAVFFVLSKQAFCNYYFLVIACVATGLAAFFRDQFQEGGKKQELTPPPKQLRRWGSVARACSISGRQSRDDRTV
jgi:hypothetical protein